MQSTTKPDVQGCADDVLAAVLESMMAGHGRCLVEFHGSRGLDLANDVAELMADIREGLQEDLGNLVWTGIHSEVPVIDQEWSWKPEEHADYVCRVMDGPDEPADSETRARHLWVMLATVRVAQSVLADAIGDWHVRNGAVDRMLLDEGLEVPVADPEPGFLRSCAIVWRAWRRSRNF